MISFRASALQTSPVPHLSFANFQPKLTATQRATSNLDSLAKPEHSVPRRRSPFPDSPTVPYLAFLHLSPPNRVSQTSPVQTSKGRSSPILCKLPAQPGLTRTSYNLPVRTWTAESNQNAMTIPKPSVTAAPHLARPRLVAPHRSNPRQPYQTTPVATEPITSVPHPDSHTKPDQSRRGPSAPFPTLTATPITTRPIQNLTFAHYAVTVCCVS